MQFVFVPLAHEHHEEHESHHQDESCQVCQFLENQSQSCSTSNQSILEVVRYFESNTSTKSLDDLYNSPFSNQESARAPPTSNSDI